MKNNRKSGFFSVKSVMLTTIFVLLFLAGILAYNAKLYSETRTRITKIGELNAESSAHRIDEYLSTGIDTLRLAGYTLDNMIRDERSQEEIRDYIINQSVAIMNITSENCTGLYGYINGEYIDGTGWVPDEDYIPDERPWYIDAKASIGRVAIVDPYMDVMTKTYMISLSKTLCDAKSVIALDFSIDMLQTISEETARTGDSYAEIVVDREYRVIAHSDKEEVGKIYLTEDDTIGGAIVKGIRSTNNSSFSLKYGGSEYIVFVTGVATDWTCISVIDATDSFRDHKRALIYVLTAGFLIIAIQIFILLRAGKNTRINNELVENLSQVENDLSEKDKQIGSISKLAYRDALTGVGNKTAFDEYAGEISQKLAGGYRDFAVVMMDVNDLKYINDTFGHESGNLYLCGCCDLVRSVYEHSDLFRIGGDEFVVILENEDYDKRTALEEKLSEKIAAARSREDVSPWERYSISVGMADCEPDSTFDQVVKHADEIMYKAKQEYKKKHGSYR